MSCINGLSYQQLNTYTTSSYTLYIYISINLTTTLMYSTTQKHVYTLN